MALRPRTESDRALGGHMRAHTSSPVPSLDKFRQSGRHRLDNFTGDGAAGSSGGPLIILLILAAALLSSCSTVKPWQRDVLSKPGMQLDPSPLISSCDDHIYFSREASKGGKGFGGGGCGCN